MPISEYLKRLRQCVGTDMLLLPAVAAIIHDTEGRVLFQRRADDGLWSLPAGSIEPDETPAGAIVREVLEETGLYVEASRVVGVFAGTDMTCTYPSGDVCQYTVVVFKCDVISKNNGEIDEETVELKYFGLHELPKLQIQYPKEIFSAEEKPTLFN